MTYERQISSGILAKTIKEFKGCNIQSKINNSGYYASDEQVDAINDYEGQVGTRNWLRNNSHEQVDVINDCKELVDAVNKQKSDPSSDPKVATYIINKTITQTLFISQLGPNIISDAIRLVVQIVTEDLPGIQKILGLCQTVLPKASVTDAARSEHFSDLQERETVQAGMYPRHRISTLM